MNQIPQHGNSQTRIYIYICICIWFYMHAYLIYELTISLLVALVTRPLTPLTTLIPLTPLTTHLFIWWLGACKRWYRGCTVLLAFLFAQLSMWAGGGAKDE